MFYAARAGHDEAIRVLVEEGGASLSVKNKVGDKTCAYLNTSF